MKRGARVNAEVKKVHFQSTSPLPCLRRFFHLSTNLSFLALKIYKCCLIPGFPLFYPRRTSALPDVPSRTLNAQNIADLQYKLLSPACHKKTPVLISNDSVTTLPCSTSLHNKGVVSPELFGGLSGLWTRLRTWRYTVILCKDEFVIPAYCNPREALSRLNTNAAYPGVCPHREQRLCWRCNGRSRNTTHSGNCGKLGAGEIDER